MPKIFQIEPSQDDLAFPPQAEKEKNLPFSKVCMIVEENRKLKVGQIYTYKGQPYVITKLMTETPYKEGRACCLYQDGYVEELWDVNAAANPLIAEYPTGQEAVNSKEFKE